VTGVQNPLTHSDTQAKGVYLRIGNTCEKVLTEAKVSAEIVARLNAECLAPDVVAQTESL